MLFMCECHLSTSAYSSDSSEPIIASLKKDISQRLAQMRVYAAMLAVRPAWGTWQRIRVCVVFHLWLVNFTNQCKNFTQADTRTQSKEVGRLLVAQRSFALARQWALLHNVTEHEIEENFILSLLDSGDTLRVSRELKRSLACCKLNVVFLGPPSSRDASVIVTAGDCLLSSPSRDRCAQRALCRQFYVSANGRSAAGGPALVLRET
jgi:hypothetical protein